MQKKYLLIIFSFLSMTALKAQTPQVFNYQAVVRNNLGNILPNKLVTFQISIIQSTALGSAVYVETHSKATNEFGLVNLKIGEGTAQNGIFSNIDWAADIYFLKVELDINAGTNYEFMGTTQILSVPYALYAEKAGNAVDDFDKDSTNELQTINKVGNTVSLSNNGGSFTDSDNQTLSLSGNQLTINNGNTVTFTGSVDLDADPLNEIQNLTLDNDTLSISQGNQVVFPHDADRDSTNEIQIISKTGNTINLSKNGGSVIETDNQNLSSTANGNNRTINISNGIGTTINIADNDSDSLNELQLLSLSNDTLYLSNSNFVVFPKDNDKDSTNEIQNLSINYKSLSISKGNSVIINYGPTFITGVNLGSVSTTTSNFNISQYIPLNATTIILEVQFTGGGVLYCSNGITSVQIQGGGGNIYQFHVPIDNNRTFNANTGSNSASLKLIAFY
ncbi:MAG: hypothetical protein PHT69_07765 [Bacteroidales bacterium]|nr:hypothetical protein [Bacteroidales bacterium]